MQISQKISIYHTTEYYLAIKKKKADAFVITWMDPKGIMLAEIGQKEKDKNRMVSLMGRIKGKQTKGQE